MLRMPGSRLSMVFLWVLLVAGMVLSPGAALANYQEEPNGYALPEKPKIYID